jgi:hypothetical protein
MITILNKKTTFRFIKNNNEPDLYYKPNTSVSENNVII